MNPIVAWLAACGLGLVAASAAPANDNLAQAIELPDLPTVVEGTTVGATQEAGEINGGYWPFHSVWYKWTAPESGGWEIGFINPELVTIIATRGTTFQNFQQVGFADSNFPNSFWADAGETYYFQVQAGQREGSPFSFRFTRGPANDAFAGRGQLPASGTFQVSTIGVATETGEPDYGPMQGRTLWWDWTPARSGSHVISILGGFEYYPLVNVFQGVSLAGLSAVATERVTTMEGLKTVFRATAGERYILRLVAATQQRQQVTFTLQFGGSNDEWENAAPLGALNTVVTGDTTGATYQPAEVSPQTRGGGTLWYSWDVPASGSYVARSVSQWGIAKVAVYRGNSVSTLVSAEQAAKPYNPGQESQFPFRANAGERLWVAVDSMDLPKGPFTLGIVRPVANDDFAAAERLEGLYAESAWREFIATVELGEREYAGIGNAGSLWWRWVAPRTASFVVRSEHEASRRIGLGVFTGSSLETLTRVTGGTNWSWMAFAGFHAVEGREYYFQVAQNPGSSDRTRLIVEIGAWNDEFANAESISSLPANGMTRFRIPTLEPDEPLDFPGKGTLWWKWTATAAGAHRFWTYTTMGERSAMEVAVFSGTTREELRLVGRSARPGEGVTFRAAQGETFYFVAAEVPNFAPEDFYVGYSLLAGPPNDDFANATSLNGGLPQVVRSTTMGATSEPGEPAHLPWDMTATVWFKWVAPFTGRVLVGTGGILGRAYAGTNLQGLRALPDGEFSNSEQWLEVVEGTQYYFAAATAPNNATPFSFRLGVPPANGNYATREVVEEIGTTLRSWTVFTGGERTVWWTWTAPQDGILMLELPPGAPPTLTRILYQEPSIGLYQADRTTALTASATNRAAVLAGRTYDIALTTVTMDAPSVSVTPRFRSETTEWSDETMLRGGESLWFEQSAVAHSGPTALQAGRTLPGQTSWAQRTFVGAGRVSFWWRRDAERLVFDMVRLPGQSRYWSAIQAQSSWTRVELPLNYGTNVVRWTAQRFSDAPGEMAIPAFVDDVVFTPDVIEMLAPVRTLTDLEVGVRADVARGVTTWFFEVSIDLRTWSQWTSRQVDSRAMTGPYEVRATYVPPANERLRFFRVRR